jgi:hypothetical protein
MCESAASQWRLAVVLETRYRVVSYRKSEGKRWRIEIVFTRFSVVKKQNLIEDAQGVNTNKSASRQELNLCLQLTHSVVMGQIS